MENIKNKFYRDLPAEIISLLLISEGWIVGSCLEKLLKDEKPNDFDIIVPNRELFQVTTRTIAALINNRGFNSYTINSYGGIKTTIGELSIDIWCEELSHFLMNANHAKYIYNFKKQVLIEVK